MTWTKTEDFYLVLRYTKNVPMVELKDWSRYTAWKGKSHLLSSNLKTVSQIWTWWSFKLKNNSKVKLNFRNNSMTASSTASTRTRFEWNRPKIYSGAERSSSKKSNFNSKILRPLTTKDKVQSINRCQTLNLPSNLQFTGKTRGFKNSKTRSICWFCKWKRTPTTGIRWTKIQTLAWYRSCSCSKARWTKSCSCSRSKYWTRR